MYCRDVAEAVLARVRANPFVALERTGAVPTVVGELLAGFVGDVHVAAVDEGGAHRGIVRKQSHAVDDLVTDATKLIDDH